VRANLPADPRPGIRAHYLMMRAYQLVNGGWDDSLAADPVDTTGLSRMVVAVDAFVKGREALGRGDRAGADRWLHRLEPVRTGAPADDSFGDNPNVVAVLRRELEGLSRLAAGDTAAALTALAEATAMEDTMPVDYGPPAVVKPSHEALGEVLLAAGRPEEAQREFTRALALAPRRALSLLGLARAAGAAGDRPTAARAWSDLRKVWARAEPGVPGLEEAVKAMSSSKGGTD
jgi:tetratricopeptide (TPR) repeat protein